MPFFKYSRYPNLDKITKIPTPKLQDLLKNWVSGHHGEFGVIGAGAGMATNIFIISYD